MTGRTNYTAVDNAAEFGFDQINAGFDHFDQIVGGSVANAGALPSTGNWVGRTVTAADTGAVYVCTALPNTWQRLGVTNPGATLIRTTDLPNGASTSPTAVPFQSATTLRGMTWSSGSATRLTATVKGRYSLSATAILGSTGLAWAWFRVNGTVDYHRFSETTGNVGVAGAARVWPLAVVTLNANDYVELMVQSDATWTVFGLTEMNADLLNVR